MRRATKRISDDERPAAPSHVLLVLVVALCTPAAVGFIALALGFFALVFSAIWFSCPERRYADERQQVVDGIYQFHASNGRYPKSLQEAGIEVPDPLGCSEYDYSATDSEFVISLTRARWFPPGEHTWCYRSDSGSWSYFSETW